MYGPIITLTTDFGPESPYVAAMKGVILSINPEARLVDVTHAVPPQDVRQGALVLATATRWFPAGSLHVAVVDPGVGTDRALVFAEIDGRGYLAPDNGLLSLLIRDAPPRAARLLTQQQHWLPEVSATFHGRDILSPVAAHLSRGLDLASLGPRTESLVTLDWPAPRVAARSIAGEVIHVDSFGNLVTNIERRHLPADSPHDTLRLTCGPLVVAGLRRTYGDASPGQPIALVGSSGHVELALVQGDAARRYSLDVGAGVEITW